MDYIICHYSEIGLKGKNRRFFEEKLVENIKKTLYSVRDNPPEAGAVPPLAERISNRVDRDYFSYVRRISGRLLIKLTEKGQKQGKEISRALKNVFGIANFAFVVSCKAEIEEIKKKSLEILEPFAWAHSHAPSRRRGLSYSHAFKTFKVVTQRSDKEFPLTSQEVNERVGEHILKRFKIYPVKSRKAGTQHFSKGAGLFNGVKDLRFKIQVDLEKPDIIVFIEIVDPIRNLSGSNGARKHAFLYREKISGPGGLPVTTGGKAVALLSGGIDSPVASYFVMKRGVKIIFVHFHAYPYTKKASIEKAKEIVEIFKKYQFDSKLYLVPFAELQKEIVLKGPAKLRMILYRRAMAKIAEKIAQKEKAQALVTGENIGQVASQTLENIRVIDEAVDLPIFRPLLGFDKEEIIEKAKEIGTFDISILPHEDCCSRFLPKHPETKARISEVKEAEKKVLLKTLTKEVMAKAEIKKC